MQNNNSLIVVQWRIRKLILHSTNIYDQKIFIEDL